MFCDFHSLPHEGIQTLAPYIPGKSAEELADEQGITDIIKLASNENPLGCSPLVTQALAEMTAKQIATYPIPAHHPLRGKIANKFGVSETMVTLANGSDMLFPLLLTSFALHTGKHVLVHDYSFIVYSIFAKTQGIPVRSAPIHSDWTIDIDAMITACTDQTALIFIANPNNPTGYRIPYHDIERLLHAIPETTILVLDEAYHEFNDGNQGNYSLTLLKKYPNLVITRTFSKAYGLAGLRIGYAIAAEQITQVLLRVLPSFTVSQTALTAAYVALDDDAFIHATVLNNRQGLQQLKRAMDELNLTYMPTDGNFITINCEQDARKIYEDLQCYGIIVRPLHPYGLANYLRVSVGTPDQNQRFIDKFAICIAKNRRGVNHEI